MLPPHRSPAQAWQSMSYTGWVRGSGAEMIRWRLKGRQRGTRAVSSGCRVSHLAALACKQAVRGTEQENTPDALYAPRAYSTRTF